MYSDPGFDVPSPVSTEHKDLVARYGQAEADWLREAIRGWWEANGEDESGHESFDCVDSNRLAREDRSDELTAYDDAVTCCGKMDVRFGPSPAGHTYLYGFNYGH